MVRLCKDIMHTPELRRTQRVMASLAAVQQEHLSRAATLVARYYRHHSNETLIKTMTSMSTESRKRNTTTRYLLSSAEYSS